MVILVGRAPFLAVRSELGPCAMHLIDYRRDLDALCHLLEIA
jgi:hypothetical protein